MSGGRPRTRHVPGDNESVGDLTTGARNAVVIGAGMAGLAAAAALSSRMQHVLLIDRDELPDELRARRGVPQSAHAHILLGAGLDALERLLPGLRADLMEEGGVAFNAGRDVSFYQF